MVRIDKFKLFACDFETTVYDGQQDTEVWASACVELYTEDVKIMHSIDEQWEYFVSLNADVIGYYHNLKFDGNFWLSFIFNKLKFKQAYNPNTRTFALDKDMPNNSFKYVISNLGQWYMITIKYNGHIIQLRDSYKLLPYSLKRIGQSFKTKHQKLEMEYKGYRYAGCEITDSEKEYIANDVLVLKEALEVMFDNEHKSLTIGSCCLNEYKNIVGKDLWKCLFPSMVAFEIKDKDIPFANADEYVRKSYRGGWCYVVEGKEKTIKHNGLTADVNSLYPSMMSSESGNRYPVGKPKFWKGNIPTHVLSNPNIYFFVRLKTRFYLKEGKLPFLQLKRCFLYPQNESLTTSDVWSHALDKYCSSYYDVDGKLCQAIPELTLTMTDYFLMLEHYDLADTVYLDGCYFQTEIGLFDDYINKYKKQKLESKGAKREEAKLFLNNLYGKMASSTDSSFKYASVDEQGVVHLTTVTANDKEAGYIPVGSAITSYAREFTIRTAQLNYYGADKRGFVYADTDSIHADISLDELKGVTVHDKDFCCWKIESFWDEAIFTRQKTYIEHITHEECEPVDKPYYLVKCAGMPTRCKDLFIMSLTQDYNINELTEEDVNFVQQKRTLEDFDIGLTIHGKLLPRRIKGGIILVDTTYEMR